MAMRRSNLLARENRPLRKKNPISGKEVNSIDLPEMASAELCRGRKVSSLSADNSKQLIAIRIDAELLSRLRRIASKRRKPYQVVLHDLLESAVRKVT